MVERKRCTNQSCRRLHTVLPDFLVPNKQYGSDLIEDVIEEVITEDDPGYEDQPCGMTMRRWKNWYRQNEVQLEGQIRSAAYRFLGLGDQFLRSTESLLKELRERISRGWLRIVLQIFVGSSGRPLP